MGTTRTRDGGEMNETRKGSDLAERIAEKLLGENESVCMLKWGAEQVRAELAEREARVERLVKLAANAEKRLYESSGSEHIRLMENENCACNSCLKRQLRAALDGMGEP